MRKIIIKLARNPLLLVVEHVASCYFPSLVDEVVLKTLILDYLLYSL